MSDSFDRPAPPTAALPPALRFSRALAIFYGVALPVGESIRRWRTDVFWFAWADDFILGAVLLLSVWVLRRRPEVGRRCLIGAWGFVCGAGMYSVVGNLRDLGLPTNTNFPRAPVAAVLVAGWLLALVALGASILARPEEPGPHARRAG